MHILQLLLINWESPIPFVLVIIIPYHIISNSGMVPHPPVLTKQMLSPPWYAITECANSVLRICTHASFERYFSSNNVEPLY